MSDERGTREAKPQDDSSIAQVVKPGTDVMRDNVREFIGKHLIDSESYGAEIIVVGRTFEDALFDFVTWAAKDRNELTQENAEQVFRNGLDAGVASLRRNDATPQAYEKIATEMASLYPRGDETADELRVRLIGALGEVTTLRQEAADRRSRSEARPGGGSRATMPGTRPEVPDEATDQQLIALVVGLPIDTAQTLYDRLVAAWRIGRDRSKAHPPIPSTEILAWLESWFGTTTAVTPEILAKLAADIERYGIEMRRPEAKDGGA